MIKKLAAAAICAIGLASPAFAAAIQIDGAHAIVNEAENEIEVFMTITNGATAADRLYAVKSKAAKTTKLNANSVEEEAALEAKGLDGGEATAFEVQPGQPLILDEDTGHIVLQDPVQALAVGDTFMITLFFENAGPVKAEIVVKSEEE